MDEEQAEVYNQRIQQLEKAAKRKGEFNTERLSIIQSSLITNDKRFKELTTKVITLNTQIKTLNTTTFDQATQKVITDNFNFLVHTAILTIIEHIRISDIIMQLLSNSISNKLTELIPTALFHENLKEISFNLAKGKRLPIDIDRQNIYEILDIVTTKTTIIENNLLIIISIPIINDIPYTLFKTVPIPTQYLNEAIMIQPSTEYILINKAASHFIPLSSIEYAECLIKQDKEIICTPNNPIYLSKHSKCEFALFNEIDIDDLNIHCKDNIRKIPNRNYFIKLQPPNYYYIYIRFPLIVRFFCAGREPEELLLSQHGILRIDDYCVMKTDTVMIEAAYTTRNKQSITIISPDLNATRLATLNYEFKFARNKVIEINSGDVTLLENFEVETNELLRRIEQMKEEEQKIEIHDLEAETYFTWFKAIKSTILLTIIGIIIIMSIRLTYSITKCTK